MTYDQTRLEKIKAADQQTTTDSSVARAEDCRKADILRSLVRGRVGGWYAGNFFTVQNWNYVGKSNIVRI